MKIEKRFTPYICVKTKDQGIIASLMNLRADKDFMSLSEGPGEPMIEDFNGSCVEIHAVCPSLANARQFAATVDHTVNKMPTDKQFELYLVVNEATGYVTRNLQKLANSATNLQLVHDFELEIADGHAEFGVTVATIGDLERLEELVDGILGVDRFAEEIQKSFLAPRQERPSLIDRGIVRTLALTGVIGVTISNWRRKLTGQ